MEYLDATKTLLTLAMYVWFLLRSMFFSDSKLDEMHNLIWAVLFLIMALN